MFNLRSRTTLASAAFLAFAATHAQATGKTGEAVLEITAKIDNVQRSNYGKNSFRILNSGSKDISSFRLDVSKALYPDSVFDPEGLAGDSVAKALQIDEDQDTGIVVPQGISPEVYLGDGGDKGFDAIQLKFKKGGFNPGESIGFSIDMDPNSIAGTKKKPLDDGTLPWWDVGGVSGAELIGSRFTVTFDDGSMASGQLFGTATQAGAHGIASQNPREAKVDLKVNRLSPGEVGTYTSGGPRIRVNGKIGTVARVIVSKGIIQPVSPYDDKLKRQLEALSKKDFPVNNAAEFLTVDVELTGEAIDISDRFDFAKVARFDFEADPKKPLSMDEGKLPLGIVAAIVDPGQNHLPLGPVTKPIYLRYD
ncbi:MAG: hypothetical protein AAGB14_12085 [Verrucomicrobiota bacterium]